MNDKCKTQIVSILATRHSDTKLFPAGGFFYCFSRECKVVRDRSVTTISQILFHDGSPASSRRLLNMVRNLPGYLVERATNWWWTNQLPLPDQIKEQD